MEAITHFTIGVKTPPIEFAVGVSEVTVDILGLQNNTLA
jgi:hypothetical protein